MHEERVARRHRLDQRDLDRRARSVRVGTQRQPARLVDAHDRHRHAVVAAGDAVLRAARLAGEAGFSSRMRRRRSLDHAGLQLLELLLVVRAHPHEQIARRARLLLVDLRDREADVDQDPVSRPDALAVVLGVEESHVDVAAYSRDVDFGQPIQIIDDLDDLPRNRQAHAGCSITRLGRIVKLW